MRPIDIIIPVMDAIIVTQITSKDNVMRIPNHVDRIIINQEMPTVDVETMLVSYHRCRRRCFFRCDWFSSYEKHFVR